MLRARFDFRCFATWFSIAAYVLNMRRFVTLSMSFFACAITMAQEWTNVVTLPITLAKDNYIHLNVKLNDGLPLDFIFDTGANICVLTERGRLKVQGLQFDATQETLGLGGVTSRPIAKKVRLAIAEHPWGELPLMLVDYHGSLAADGVIGYNVFANKTISLDYDRGVLQIGDGLPPTVERMTPLKVTMTDDLPFLPVTLHSGSAEISDLFEMDTGFRGASSVSARLAKRAHLPGNLRRFGSAKMGGTGSGVIETVVVELPSLSLGSQKLSNVPADIQMSDKPEFKVWNMLGNDVLKRFNIVWDIRGKRAYVSLNHLAGDRYNLPPNRRLILGLLSTAIVLLILGISWILRRRRMAKLKVADSA